MTWGKQVKARLLKDDSGKEKGLPDEGGERERGSAHGWRPIRLLEPLAILRLQTGGGEEEDAIKIELQGNLLTVPLSLK